MSVFSGVDVAPPDAILGTAIAFRQDPNPIKVNLGIGAYRTDEGLPYVFPVVKEVEKELAEDASLDKEYLPIDGLAELKPARPIPIKSPQIKKPFPFIVFKGLEIREYRYWDPATKGVDFEGLLTDLEEAPFMSVLVLHACAHNPTGVDLTESQWAEVVQLCDRRRLLPVIDLAYQGFASGDLERDALAIRMFVDKFKGGFFVAQSFAKNLGLYGERIGMLHAVCTTPGEAEAVLSQIKVVARRMYSSPPLHGARILARVLGSKERMQQWQSQLKCVAERIRRARELLRRGLEKKQTPGSWGHITDQIGMFSFTGLSRGQCELLISKWHIYLLKNGRISIVSSD
ncbi:hypothetical protein Emag_007082 [Eimeria magna]